MVGLVEKSNVEEMRKKKKKLKKKRGEEALFSRLLDLAQKGICYVLSNLLLQGDVRIALLYFLVSPF